MILRGGFMLELNKFYVAEAVSFMKNNIPDNFVDLTVTSPPYDNLRTYKGFVFDYQSILNELFRVTKIGGVVVWVVGDATINGSETGTSFKHTRAFPVEMVKDLLQCFPNAQIILDPFIGSGTTAIASLELGRSFIGFEINPEYVELANQRIKNYFNETGSKSK